MNRLLKFFYASFALAAISFAQQVGPSPGGGGGSSAPATSPGSGIAKSCAVSSPTFTGSGQNDMTSDPYCVTTIAATDTYKVQIDGTAQVLQDTNFPNGTSHWATCGSGFVLGANTATYTYGSGPDCVYQQAHNVSYQLGTSYTLHYTISSVTNASNLTCGVSTSSGNVLLPEFPILNLSTGTHDINFTLGPTNGYFTVNCTGTNTGHVVFSLMSITVDTFEWQINGGSFSTGNSINAGIQQNLVNGVSIQFAASSGHTIGNYWTMTATQSFVSTNTQTTFTNVTGTTSRASGYLTSGPLGFNGTTPAGLVLNIKAQPYNASGSPNTTTVMGLLSSGATSIPTSDVIDFVAGQGIYIMGAGVADAIGGTITYVSGGTVTGSGTCIATASNGGGTGAGGQISVSSGTISGAITITSPGLLYTGAPTSWTLSAGPLFAGASTCSGTIITTGGVLVGEDYIGTVQTVNSGTGVITVTPATSTTVADGTTIQHDETVAFQAALNQFDQASGIGGTILVPDGTYNLNGPLQDPYGVNSVIYIPNWYNAYDGSGNGIWNSITIKGVNRPTTPVGSTGATNFLMGAGSVIQTLIQTNTGALLGGRDISDEYEYFTQVFVHLENLEFRSYPDPNITLINGTDFLTMSLDNVGCDSNDSSNTQPTNPNGICVKYPKADNWGAQHSTGEIMATNMYIGVVAGEHTHIDYLLTQYNMIGVSPTAGGGHGIKIGRYLAQSDQYAIGPAGSTPIFVDNYDQEVGTTWGLGNGIVCYDPTNTITGSVSNTYAGGGTPISKIGCKGMAVYNLLPESSMVTFSATPTFDLAASPYQVITLTNNVTSSTVLNLTRGSTANFLICQDSGGLHTFVWPTVVKGGMTVGVTANKCSAQSFSTWDGATLYATTPGVTSQ